MPHLNPFFSYFGSKYKIGPAYPPPQHDEIIEPFAGSADYALRYPHKQVTLYDRYEPICELWNWLIHADEEEIMNLPLGPFDREHPIASAVDCVPARTLIGFWVHESQTSPSPYPQSPRGGNWTAAKRKLIARQVRWIRHWKVACCSYEEIPNRTATWFVDPPYRQAGKRYRHSRIDYPALADWCQERSGQTVVCEGACADWLPFQRLHTHGRPRNGSNQECQEQVWCNLGIPPPRQMNLLL